jgi:tRNA U34 5-methylaminomethyl-2-thiouridine-forming methyltransferase MnmC
MPDELQIIVTSDGSSSLLNTALNETYHSTHGAIQESNHVFIKNGLQYFVEKTKTKSVSIFEVGLGTGLNALLSIKFSDENNLKIHYTAIEAFPIDWPTASQLNYTSQLRDKSLTPYFKQIHESDWGKEIILSEHFLLHKIHSDLLSLQINPNQFDIIFFDAFAPSRQPEMWTLPVMERISSAMKVGGMFVTYCAKGQLKRNLKSLGLTVESLSGPPGKREMVRAVEPID